MKKPVTQTQAEEILNAAANDLFFMIWDSNNELRPLPENVFLKDLLICKWRAFSYKTAAVDFVSKRVAKKAKKYAAAMVETFALMAQDNLSRLNFAELSESEKLEVADLFLWFAGNVPRLFAGKNRNAKNEVETVNA